MKKKMWEMLGRGMEKEAAGAEEKNNISGRCLSCLEKYLNKNVFVIRRKAVAGMNESNVSFVRKQKERKKCVRFIHLKEDRLLITGVAERMKIPKVFSFFLLFL